MKQTRISCGEMNEECNETTMISTESGNKTVRQGKFNRMPWRERKLFSFFLFYFHVALMHESGKEKHRQL